MPTTKPLLHKLTDSRLTALQSNPPHALLLTGPPGSGKGTVAQWTAATILQHDGDLSTYPYLLQIAPVGGKAIGIEVVRQLEHLLSLKIPSTQNIARMVIIYDAHLLSTEAQNALLKTLEEPPQDTMLILTSSQQESLLPTIKSRLQTIEVIRPEKSALAELLKNEGVPEVKLRQLQALSGGLPGLALALARDDQSHPLVAATTTARQLLQQSSFEKLAQVDTLAKNRELAQNVVYILVQMSHAALLTGKGSDRWQKTLTAAYKAEESLHKGTQPKLALTNLMLNL